MSWQDEEMAAWEQLQGGLQAAGNTQDSDALLALILQREEEEKFLNQSISQDEGHNRQQGGASISDEALARQLQREEEENLEKRRKEYERQRSDGMREREREREREAQRYRDQQRREEEDLGANVRQMQQTQLRDEINKSQQQLQAALSEVLGGDLQSPDMDTKLDELVYQVLRHHVLRKSDGTEAIDSTLDRLNEAISCYKLSLRSKYDLVNALAKVCGSNDTFSDEDEALVLALTKGNAGSGLLVPFLLLKLATKLLHKDAAYSVDIFEQSLKIVYRLEEDTVKDLGVLVYAVQWSIASALELADCCAKGSSESTSCLLRAIRTRKLLHSDVCELINGHDDSSNLPNHTRVKRWIEKKAAKECDKSIDEVIGELKSQKLPQNILETTKKVLERVSVTNHSSAATSAQRCQSTIKRLSKVQLSSGLSSDFLAEVLENMSVVVHSCKRFYPRITQLASLAIMLLMKKIGSGCLLEISTGEGKSTVIAMLAAILAMFGFVVDIVTSSKVLASRDAKEWRRFYSSFGLTCASTPPRIPDNCTTIDEIDQHYRSIYEANIVYGTSHDFTGDTLRQDFDKRYIKGSRRFEIVIVDEVDSMMLDNGIHFTYLAHQTSGLWHVEQILAMIWFRCSQCMPIRDVQSGSTLWTSSYQDFRTLVPVLVASIVAEGNSATYERVLRKVSSEISACSVNKKLTSLDSQKLLTLCTKVLGRMGVEDKIDCYTLNRNGEVSPSSDNAGVNIHKILLVDTGKCCTLQDDQSIIYDTIQNMTKSIKYSNEYQSSTRAATTGQGAEKEVLVIPSFLKQYVQNRLPVFVENAFRAKQMIQGREYVIADGRDVSDAATATASKEHRHHKIIPVDFESTGVMQKSTHWSDGLHQFLEMKHNLSISTLSTVTNFMSNYRFFQRYLEDGCIFGVTGTLGDDADRDFLRSHYSSQCYSIPSHRQSKLLTLPMAQEHGHDMWSTKICQAISKASQRDEQATLLVCEDLKTSEEFHQLIRKERVARNVRLYVRSDTDTDVVERVTYGPGDVVITTTLGGRGSDFKVTDAVNKNGGLFVLLTYYPRNLRIERQLMGRTARKGNPGTFQMILNKQTLPLHYQGESIEYMLETRTEIERRRLQRVEQGQLANLKVREDIFAVFCRELDKFTQEYSEEERTKKELTYEKWADIFLGRPQMFDFTAAVCALKESWAFWLVLNEKRIEECSNSSNLQENLLSTVRSDMRKLRRGESDNPYIYAKQALFRAKVIEANTIRGEVLAAGARFLQAFNPFTSNEATSGVDDFGTPRLWDKAIEKEKVYKAAALYNKAYIVVKLRTAGYKSKAAGLLQESLEALEAYMQAINNTSVFVALAGKLSSYTQHHEDSNFQKQQEIRMTLLHSWQDTVKKALEMLRSTSKEDRLKAKQLEISCSVDDPLVDSEKVLLRELGVECFYELEKQVGWRVINKLLSSAINIVGGVLTTLNPALAVPVMLTTSLVKRGVNALLGEVEGFASLSETAKSVFTSSLHLALNAFPVTATLTKFVPESLVNVVEKFLPSVPAISESAGQADISLPSIMTMVGKELKDEVTKRSGSEALRKAGSKMASTLNEKTQELVKKYSTELQKQLKDKIDDALKKSQALTLALETYVATTYFQIYKSTIMKLQERNQHSGAESTGQPQSPLQQPSYDNPDADKLQALHNLKDISDVFEKQMDKEINNLLPEVTSRLDTIESMTDKAEDFVDKASSMFRIDDHFAIKFVKDAVQTARSIQKQVRDIVESLPLQTKLVPQIGKDVQDIVDKLISTARLAAELGERSKELLQKYKNDREVEKLRGNISRKIAEKVATNLSYHFTEKISKALLDQFSKAMDGVDKVVCDKVVSWLK